MAVTRYMLVSTNPADKIIKDGPILWDGVTPLELPADQQPISDDDARTAGYTFPPRAVAEANADDLRSKSQLALTVNAAFLALTTPTNAQSAAQVVRLTRQVSTLIRLTLGETGTTDGT